MCIIDSVMIGTNVAFHTDHDRGWSGSGMLSRKFMLLQTEMGPSSAPTDDRETSGGRQRPPVVMGLAAGKSYREGRPVKLSEIG